MGNSAVKFFTSKNDTYPHAWSQENEQMKQEVTSHFISTTTKLPVDAEHCTLGKTNPCHPF
jgi:phage I-like protein